MNRDFLLLVCTILVFGMFMQSAAGPNATNTTATAYVFETISVTLSFPEDPAGINFPDLSPGTYNNSANTTLNISIDFGTNVRTNISQKAGGNFISGPDILPIDNLIYNNLSIYEHTVDYNVTMLTSYPASPPFSNWINISKPTGGVSQYRNSSYYLTIPDNQSAGTYTTNISINVTRSYSI